MKLSESTIKIISNFSTIAPSMVIQQGDNLSVMSVAKNIIANAKVDNTFPDKINIPQISMLLSALSVIHEPELLYTPGESHFTLKGKNGQTKLTVCEDKFVEPYKGRSLDLSSRVPDIDIDFSAELLESCRKIVSALKLNTISITNSPDDKVLINITNGDLKNSGNSHTFETQNSAEGKEFNFVLDANTIKNIPVDYNLKIYSSRIAQFVSEDGNLTYWVSLDEQSYCN